MDNQVAPFLVEKWTRGFHFFDQNKDGVITREDFAAVADYISKKTGATEEQGIKTRREWTKWYDILQSDPQSKQIDLESYLDGPKELHKDPIHHDELNKATANDLFDRIDFNKDDKISFEELSIFYEAVGVTDRAAMRDAFDHIDKDGDGFIDREELVDEIVRHFGNPDPTQGKTYLLFV